MTFAIIVVIHKKNLLPQKKERKEKTTLFAFAAIDIGYPFKKERTSSDR